MRNILVHGYFQIDLDEVWSVVEMDVPVLKPKIEAILKELGARPRRSRDRYQPVFADTLSSATSAPAPYPLDSLLYDQRHQHDPRHRVRPPPALPGVQDQAD